MNAVESKQNEVVGADQNKAPIVFFSEGMGVSFSDANSIAGNKSILDVLTKVSADDIVKENGTTSFTLSHVELGYFLHMVYANCPQDKLVQVDFDGIWPFQAKDVNGKDQLFNAQLLTIREIDVQ
jgi:hypothetical protein